MRQKVLVIDDEKDLCALIMRILSEAKFETDCAHDLQTGKSKWESWNPELVLLDNNLPDGTGLDLLETNPALLKNSMVIMITADPQSGTRERAKHLGIRLIITKPFTMNEIRQVVERIRA